MKLMLDTSAYSAFKRSHPDVIVAIRRADEILLPSTVHGELLAGFETGSRTEENRSSLNEFLKIYEAVHSLVPHYCSRERSASSRCATASFSFANAVANKRSAAFTSSGDGSLYLHVAHTCNNSPHSSLSSAYVFEARMRLCPVVPPNRSPVSRAYSAANARVCSNCQA